MATKKVSEEQKSNNKPENINDATPEKDSVQANQEEQAELKVEKELKEANEALISAEEQAKKAEQARLKAEEELKEANEALTTAEKQAKKEEQARLKAEEKLKETQAALTSAEEQADKEEQARLKAEEELKEAQEALTSAEKQAKKEKQTRLKTKRELTKAQKDAATAKEESEAAKKALASAEFALAQAEKNLINEAETTEPPPSSKVEGSQDVVSFIVRVTYDTQGKPLLSNIGPSKDVREGKEPKRFQGLDGQGFVDYIEDHIRSLVATEATTPPIYPRDEGEFLPQSQDTQDHMTIPEVQVYSSHEPDAKRSIFWTDENIMLRAFCEVPDPDAIFKSAEVIQLKLHVHARELTSGNFILLATRKAKISKADPEDSVEVPLRRLTPGLYRFVITITLQTPISEKYHYDGPGIKVIGAKSSVNNPNPQQEKVLVH